MSFSPMMITLSPEGAARAYGLQIIQELENKLGKSNVHIFDFQKWQQLSQMILNPQSMDFKEDLQGQSLLTQCVAYGIKILLVLPLCPLTNYYLRLCRNLQIKTIHWFYEDFRAAHYFQDVCMEYDLFLGVQKGNFPQMVQAKGGNYAYLNLGYSFKFNNKINLSPWYKREYDFVFVGIPSSNRIQILNALAQAEFRVAVAGDFWQGRGLDTRILNLAPHTNWIKDEMSIEFYQNSKYGLNLSVEGLEQDYVGQYQHQQISPRCFDMLACGCRLVLESTALSQEILNSFNPIYYQNTLHLIQEMERRRFQSYEISSIQAQISQMSLSCRIDELLEQIKQL